MKKYGKLFILCLISFFALTVPVFAREVTPNELGKEASNLYTNQNKTVGYIYVVGEYAFTSQHILTTQDLMLSAKSIQIEYNGSNKDVALDAMTIHKISPKRDPFTGEVTGWEKENNLLGTTAFPNKLNIRYIDYNYLKDLFTVTLDLNGGNLPEGKETTLNIIEGEKISESDITGENRPTQKGKQFKEWVKEDGTPWDFETPVTSNMTLKATWYEEVNTDELLKTSVSAIQSTDYGVTFENGTLTFNEYDLNKNINEIEETGLVGTIRDILKNKNVKELTVNETKFTFDKSEADENEEKSKVYGKLQELLASVTGKDFVNIVQGDLVGKKLTITIALDEDNARSQNNNISEDYEIEFSYNAPATVTVPDENEDFTNFNYTLENTYTIDGADGLYNVTGLISEQEGVKGFGNNTTGYYFAYTIKLNDGIDASKAKVKVPVDYTETKYNEADFDTNTRTVTVLMEVEKGEVGEAATNGYRDIIVEVDGVPTKIRIKFSKLNLELNSKSTIEDAKNQQKLESSYKWKAPENYAVNYNVQENNTTEATVKAAGFLPIYNGEVEKLPFAKDHDTGYYIAFAINTRDNKEDNTTVTIKDGEEEFSWAGKDFDDENTIYILKHLHSDAKTRTFTIEVDMDGVGEKYEPYTITVDWSGLELQKESYKTEIKAIIGEEGKKELDSEDQNTLDAWKYDFNNSGNIIVEDGDNLNAYKLTGNVKEQKIDTKAAGFSGDKGYYVVVKIYGPNEETVNSNSHLEKGKWTVQLQNELGEYMPVVEANGKEFITALIKLKNEEGNKKFTYKIDWDGAGDYFLPYEETIDYSSELKFVELHEIKFNGSDEIITVWDGEEETLKEKIKEQIKNVEPEQNPQYNSNYYTFKYWTKQDGTQIDENTPVKQLLEETLEPHYSLDSEKFVNDIIDDLNEPKGTEQGSHSQDFHAKIFLDKEDLENGNVKIKIIDANTTLSEMNNTSIPGAIAYALEKDEINEITFKVDENNKVTFNKLGVKTAGGISLAEELPLKQKVKNGLQELYAKVLGDGASDTEVTLSSMVSTHPNFEISIDSYDKKKITLSKTKYKFTFESSVAVVGNEKEFKSALNNNKITDILVKNSFELTDENDDTKKSHTLVLELQGRELKIRSLNTEAPVTISDTERTVEGETDITPVIEVKSGNVTFEDIKIKGATRAITVDAGATVTARNVTAVGSQDAGFDVAEKATFTGINLQYKDLEESKDKESYHYPTVCGKGKVTLKNADETNANAAIVTNYKRIVRAETGKFTEADFKNPETGKYYDDFLENGQLKSVYQDMIDKGTKNPPDLLSSTGHTHYYLKEENSKYYTFYFRDSRINLIIVKYFAKTDTITPPVDHSYNESEKANGLHFFIKAQVRTKDGEQKTFVHDGWSKTENDDEFGANTKSQKVDNFEFPANTTTIQNYYTHFSEGYRVRIPIYVDGVEKNGIFGIVKPEEGKQVTIQDLIDQDSEFKEAFEVLQQKATSTQQQVINKLKPTSEVNNETPITENMELVIGKVQADSLTNLAGSSSSEITTKGNKLYGLLSTQSEDGKYYLPVTLTSDNFQDNVSTVKVTDPNGNEKTYTYSSASEDGIATVSTVKTMNLQLEAIKASNIKSGKKVYNIAIDVDGENADEYAVKNIALDYSEVETLEEKINKAANATLEATSLTVTKNNHINGYTEEFTYQYNTEEGLTYLKAEKDNVEEYTFSVKYAGITDDSSKVSVVARKRKVGEEDSGVYLNDWVYVHPLKTGRAIQEVTMLTDVMGETPIKAIDKVKLADGQKHTYEVTLNRDKYNNWVKTNYLSNSGSSSAEWALNETVTVYVELDDSEQYIKSIKTSQKSSENTFDVIFENVNNTNIQEPKEFLAKDGATLTDQDIKDFYENGKKWWDKHIHENAYK